jgi:uncharacterized protein YdhG (YjbR/CyaY superfamily)
VKAKSRNVDDYMDEIPDDRKPIIHTLRKIVLEEIPNVKETMSYGMPTYETKEWICAFASQKNYVSVYFRNLELLLKYKKELGNVNLGKSCIRFRKIDDQDWDEVRKMFKQASRV